MFEDGSGLKELFNSKTAELKSKALDDYDNGFVTSLPSMDSTFLGPILWEDTLTISDLDNINLDEFTPEVLGSSVSTTTETTENSNQLDELFDFTPVSTPRVNLAWTKAQCRSITATKKQATTVAPTEGKREVTDVSRPSRKKSIVPVEERNEKYWNRRIKNNESAKRSRDARRLLESQVHMKAAELEQQNQELKIQLNSLIEENKQLRELLRQSNIPSPPMTEYYPYVKDEHVDDVMVYPPILPKPFVPVVALNPVYQSAQPPPYKANIGDFGYR